MNNYIITTKFQLYTPDDFVQGVKKEKYPLYAKAFLDENLNKIFGEHIYSYLILFSDINPCNEDEFTIRLSVTFPLIIDRHGLSNKEWLEENDNWFYSKLDEVCHKKGYCYQYYDSSLL